jgi:hypothetical protein
MDKSLKQKILLEFDCKYLILKIHDDVIIIEQRILTDFSCT